MLNLTPEQWTKVIVGFLTFLGILVAAIFAVNKRTHKIRNIGGSNNIIINGDNEGKIKNKNKNKTK